MADKDKGKYSSAELQRWLIEKAEATKSPDVARRTILTNDQRGRSIAMLGRLYFFKYAPIGRYTLPKYDKFPMCVPIERYGNGFLGLNLHYLSGGSRMALLNMLLTTRNTFELSDVTVMKVNYQKIIAVDKVARLAMPCIHRYVFSQVRSRFIEIYPSEYEKAVQLPVEDWVFNS